METLMQGTYWRERNKSEENREGQGEELFLQDKVAVYVESSLCLIPWAVEYELYCKVDAPWDPGTKP